MHKFLTILMVLLLLAPATVMATTIDELQEELDALSDRLERAERKVAVDRVSFTGDLRTRIHTTSQEVYVHAGVATTGGAANVQRYDFKEKNDVLYDTRLRLGMQAKVADNVKFSGRLQMYKNWGDSTGVQSLDSWNAFTMDGTNGGNTTGDWLRVDRAMFVWNDIGDTPFYLSIGRRPSTYGAPSNYRENEQRGGTPLGHTMHFNFDGVTIGYKLSQHTDVEGQTLRFCYGQGFESQLGNGTLFGSGGTQTSLEDTHFGGFNFDVWNNETSWLQAIAFGASNISDGFKGVAVMPYADMMTYVNGTGFVPGPGTPNTNQYVTRMAPTTNVGNMILAGLGGGYTTENEMTFFGSFGFTRLMANDSFNPMGFGGMMSDAAPIFDGSFNFTNAYNTNGVGEDHNGYSIYVGVQIPAPMGKFGLEYNYGSEYWTPFTQAQDDVLGSKLATRGQVGEAYYIFDINPRTFIKLAGLYYDYEYTGSGSVLGKPQKVDDVIAGTAMSAFPVVDKAYDINATFTVKF